METPENDFTDLFQFLEEPDRYQRFGRSPGAGKERAPQRQRCFEHELVGGFAVAFFLLARTLLAFGDQLQVGRNLVRGQNRPDALNMLLLDL